MSLQQRRHIVERLNFSWPGKAVSTANQNVTYLLLEKGRNGAFPTSSDKTKNKFLNIEDQGNKIWRIFCKILFPKEIQEIEHYYILTDKCYGRQNTEQMC